VKDIVWLRPDGIEMSAEDWAAPEQAAIAFRLDGLDGAARLPHAGREALFVMMNGQHEPMPFALPGPPLGERWKVLIDTREAPRVGETSPGGAVVELDEGSLVVWVESS
jgi:glycogen operon protein